jgi:molybdopterin converting factor small subunit
MPRVFIPPLLRVMAGGAESVVVPGKTVREVIDELDARFPGIGRHLREGDSLCAGLSVVIDADVSPRGLLQKVDAASEVHFLPPIGGG